MRPRPVLITLTLVGLGLLARRGAGRLPDWLRTLQVELVSLRRRRQPTDVMAPLVCPGATWVLVAEGGDNRPGRFDTFGECPCQHTYSVAFHQTRLRSIPLMPFLALLIARCLAAPPRRPPPPFSCPGPCVSVCTHQWWGWTLMQDLMTGRCVFNCHTFAQYHCKQPTDPDALKPPKPHHPDSESPL